MLYCFHLVPKKNIFICFRQFQLMDFYGKQYPPPQLLEKWRPIHDICVQRTGVSEGDRICLYVKWNVATNEQTKNVCDGSKSILPFALEHITFVVTFFVNEFMLAVYETVLMLPISLRRTFDMLAVVYLYNVCILQMPLNDLVMGTKSLKKTT